MHLRTPFRQVLVLLSYTEICLVAGCVIGAEMAGGSTLAGATVVGLLVLGEEASCFSSFWISWQRHRVVRFMIATMKISITVKMPCAMTILLCSFFFSCSFMMFSFRLGLYSC